MRWTDAIGYYGVMLRVAIYLVISVIAVVAAVACGSEEPSATLESTLTQTPIATPEHNPTSVPSPTPESNETPDPTSGPDMQAGAEVGDMAPVFTLPSASGTEVSLESYRGDKTVVLVFYRGSF